MISKVCFAGLMVVLVCLTFYPLSGPFPAVMSDAEKAITGVLVIGFAGVIAAIKETKK